MPLGETAGWPPAVNRALLSFVTVKVSVWLASLVGPALILVAQPVCGSALSPTLWLAPLVNAGASLTAEIESAIVATLLRFVPSLAW